MGGKAGQGARPPLGLTLVEQVAVHTAVDAAIEKWPRAELVWEDVTWAIMRDPEVGEPITESGKTRSITMHGAKSAGLPDVTVVYEVQNPFIIIHAARFKEPRKPYAGRA